jgi:CspA family cold shock protein
VGSVRGTVKWFSLDKQFGFLLPDDGGPDVFVHISDVTKAGLRELREGQEIEFDTIPNKGRVKAVNVSIELERS